MQENCKPPNQILGAIQENECYIYPRGGEGITAFVQQGAASCGSRLCTISGRASQICFYAARAQPVPLEKGEIKCIYIHRGSKKWGNEWNGNGLFVGRRAGGRSWSFHS